MRGLRWSDGPDDITGSIRGKLLGHGTRPVEQAPIKSLMPVERRGALEMRPAGDWGR